MSSNIGEDQEPSSFAIDYDDDEEEEEPLTLDDVKMMYEKLKEIQKNDSDTQRQLRKSLEEIRGSSLLAKLSSLKYELTQLMEKVELIRQQNQLLGSIDLSELIGRHETIVSKLIGPMVKMVKKDELFLKEYNFLTNLLFFPLKASKHCQTDSTWPSTSSSLPTLTSSPPSSSSLEKPFDAQDKFIEMLAHKNRQLEEKLDLLKRQIWYEGPDVMLVKVDEFTKLVAKTKSRKKKVKKVKKEPYFDGYLEITDRSGDDHPGGYFRQPKDAFDDVELYFDELPSSSSSSCSQSCKGIQDDHCAKK